MSRADHAARVLLLATASEPREVFGSCRRCGGTTVVVLLSGLGLDVIEPDPLLAVVALEGGRLVVVHRVCGGTLRLVA